jgi:hypothetical protein
MATNEEKVRCVLWFTDCESKLVAYIPPVPQTIRELKLTGDPYAGLFLGI